MSGAAPLPSTTKGRAERLKVLVVGPGDKRVRRLLRDLSEIEGIDASTGTTDDASHRDLTIGLHSTVEEHISSARASIEAGSHFISASHSSQIAEALASNFKATSGPGVIAGVDWTPGITCTLAARAGMDEVDQVKISWVVSAAGSSGWLAVERTLDAFSNRAIIFEDGSWRRVKPGQESEQVFLPEPLGWREVWDCAGAESLFLPKSHPHLSRVAVRAGVTEPLMAALLRKTADMNSLSVRWMMRNAIKLPLRDASGTDAAWSAARVDLYGKTKRSYAFMDQLSNLWTAPIVAVVKLWEQTRIPGGTSAMYEVFSPADLLDTLRQNGLQLARLQPGMRTMS